MSQSPGEETPDHTHTVNEQPDPARLRDFHRLCRLIKRGNAQDCSITSPVSSLLLFTFAVSHFSDAKAKR